MLGVLPGIIGTLQATEAIKLVTGIGNPMVGRLLLLDAAAMEFRTIGIRRDPDCPTCGETRSDTLMDYERFCGVGEDSGLASVGLQGVSSVTPLELSERLAQGDDIDLVDVREEWEWEMGHIPGARLVPLAKISAELSGFGGHVATVLYCEVGLRSLKAARQLASAGVANVVNVEGGMARWRLDVDSGVPQY